MAYTIVISSWMLAADMQVVRQGEKPKKLIYIRAFFLGKT